MDISKFLAKKAKQLPSYHPDMSFEGCIKCTACTAVCPVSANNPLYPGPKQAGPDGERLRLKSVDFYDQALKYCTNCKRCEIACPSDVKIGDMIVKARNRHLEQQAKPMMQKLRDTVLSNTDILGQLSTPFAPVVNGVTRLKATRFLLEKTLQVASQRILPQYSFGTFRRWYQKQAKQQERFHDQVAYYHGCYVNYNNPKLGIDLIRLLNAMEIGVQLVEKEKCCSVPLMVNGFPHRAKKQAQHNILQLEQAVLERQLDIVGTSSTCTLTLRDEYDHVLGLDNHRVRPHIQLITRYLYRWFEQGRQPKFKTLPLKVAYHTACHMEKSGWIPYTLGVLQQIPGLEVVRLESRCCGIAGTYGFKKENYAVAQAIGSPLFKMIEEADVDYVISDCETCKWQIEMSTSRECLHPVTLLVMALEA